MKGVLTKEVRKNATQKHTREGKRGNKHTQRLLLLFVAVVMSVWLVAMARGRRG